MEQKPYVFVDFNGLDNFDDGSACCWLLDAGKRDLLDQGVEIAEGLEVVAYMEDIETDGVLAFSKMNNIWACKIDLDAYRDVPFRECP